MANVVLKVRSKSGQNLVVDHLKSSSTVFELKEFISPKVSIAINRIVLLSGYPLRALDVAGDDTTLEGAGIKSGDVLGVDESTAPIEKAEKVTEAPKSHVLDNEQKGGVLLRKVVPADNSCLFTSLGFVLGGKVDTTCGTHMRQIIAEVISSNEDEYSEAILGRSNKEYCKWILKPDSWGGAIDIAVLSNFYGVEIAVVDTMNAIVNHFGEDKNFDHRVFLIFDGIHYDPLYKEFYSPVDSNIQTMFPRIDVEVLSEANELAHEAKSSRQYTDVDRFTLVCLVCRVKLTGQTEAQAHAKSTGHANFGETTS